MKNTNLLGIHSLVKIPPYPNAYKCYSSDNLPNQQLFDSIELPTRIASSNARCVLGNYLEGRGLIHFSNAEALHEVIHAKDWQPYLLFDIVGILQSYP